jgi:LemA protein
MTKSVVIVSLIAVCLFWAVGAYNRLVRLRAEAVRAFAAVDDVLSLLPALIQAAFQMHRLSEAGGAGPVNDAALHSERLTAAGQQFSGALSNLRAKPLDPALLAVFLGAQNELAGVWRAVAEPANEQCRADLPPGLQERVAQLTAQSDVPAALFDESVRTYNAAIQQFPASVLARIWGLRAAACLRAHAMDKDRTLVRTDD